MHNELILSAFKKATDSLENKGVISPSKSAAAELLSDYIDDQLGFRFGERRLRDYYNSALNGDEVEIKQQAVRNGLSHYLGSNSFEEWLLETNKIVVKPEILIEQQEGPSNFLIQFIGKYKVPFLIALGGLISFISINSFHSEKWMMWEGSQFVQTNFDGHKMEKGQLVVLNPDRIDHFKRIDPNCDTKFFNADGSAQLWYGKNLKGELQYFTDLGRHPETGRTLKPITKYMIGKYICVGGKRDRNLNRN